MVIATYIVFLTQNLIFRQTVKSRIINLAFVVISSEYLVSEELFQHITERYLRISFLEIFRKVTKYFGSWVYECSGDVRFHLMISSAWPFEHNFRIDSFCFLIITNFIHSSFFIDLCTILARVSSALSTISN